MTFMTFDETLALGVPSVDAEHRTLVDMINDLHRAVQAGTEDSKALDMVDRLKRYAQTHFQTEEELLVGSGYPGFKAHQAEHVKFIKQVRDFDAACRAGTCALSSDVLAFLKDWLTTHIRGTDRAYVPHLKAKGLA